MHTRCARFTKRSITSISFRLPRFVLDFLLILLVDVVVIYVFFRCAHTLVRALYVQCTEATSGYIHLHSTNVPSVNQPENAC